jgi:VanZ family protein
LWVLIFIYIGFIYATLPLARSVLNYLYGLLGKFYLSVGVNLALIGAMVVLLYFFMKKGFKNLLYMALPAGILLAISLTLERPEERVHFIQYGLLGFLVYKGFESSGTLKVPLAGGFVFLVGSVDEIIQWFLPNRVGDLRDVAFNFLGGIAGIWLGRVYFSS